MTSISNATRLPAQGVDLIYAETESVVEGRLHTEPAAKGLVIIAYPTAYSRFGRQDELLCAIAHEQGYSTLSVDLLTPEETTVRTDALPARLLQRLAAVLRDSNRRGQTGLCIFAIGEAAPAAIPAADDQEVHAIATCALPGVMNPSDADLDRAAVKVLECTPTLDAPMTWEDVDQAMRRALVWFDAALEQHR